jgi:hypothetical protein
MWSPPDWWGNSEAKMAMHRLSEAPECYQTVTTRGTVLKARDAQRLWEQRDQVQSKERGLCSLRGLHNFPGPRQGKNADFWPGLEKSVTPPSPLSPQRGQMGGSQMLQLMLQGTFGNWIQDGQARGPCPVALRVPHCCQPGQGWSLPVSQLCNTQPLTLMPTWWVGRTGEHTTVPLT